MTEKDDTSWLDDVDDEAEDWLRCQPPEEGDVLSPRAAPDEGENAFLQVLYDDSTPKTSYPTVPIGTSAKYVESIRALKRIRPNQRTFIRALVQEAGNVGRALKLYNARHTVKLNHAQVSRWCHNPDYHKALTDAKNYFLDLHGIDPSSVMLRAAKVYEEAMEPHPVLHQGRPTGYYERELGTAARIVETQGKWAGLDKGETASNRVRVRIIRMSSRGQGDEAIEVESGGTGDE
jgi:hypothetical protein